MKITIETNDGQKKELEADVVAMSAQNGEGTRIIILGEGTAIQHACVCEGLLDARKEILEKHPSIKAIIDIKDILGGLKGEEEEPHDES